MNLRKTLLFLLLACAIGPAPRAEQAALSAFEALQLERDIDPTRARIPIEAFGRRFVMTLDPNRALLASLPAPQRARIAAGDLFLTGALEGIPGSWVRLNRIDGRFSGGFFDGSELYLVDRAAGFSGTRSRGLSPDQTIVYRFGDLDLPGLVDHGGVKPGERTGPATEGVSYDGFVEHLREVATLQGTAMFAMPLTIVSDVQFTGRHGGNTAAVVAGRINFVDGIFSSQLGTGITLLHHKILDSNGTLTSSNAGELLDQFGTFLNSGAGSSIPLLGLAHLLTNRDIFSVDDDGNQRPSTVGIAYLGVLCNPFFGLGIDEDLDSDTTSALVIAHELGHNFNAPHDGQAGDGQSGACVDETFNGIMNPFINGSQQFSDCSLREMSVEVGGASCLVEAIDSQVLFGDGFE